MTGYAIAKTDRAAKCMPSSMRQCRCCEYQGGNGGVCIARCAGLDRDSDRLTRSERSAARICRKQLVLLFCGLPFAAMTTPTLTSASSFDDVVAEFKDTMSYRQQASTALAERFVVACTYLIGLRPTATQKGRQGWNYDASELKELRNEARRYVAARSSTATDQKRVLQASCKNFRT